MKRLTIRNSDGSVSQPTDLNWAAALEKLAAYEDTGLDPEEVAYFLGTTMTVKDAKAQYAEHKKRYDEYMAWKQAEAEGRLVVLPCKVGQEVFRIRPGHCEYREQDMCIAYCDGWDYECPDYEANMELELGRFTLADCSEFGKSVFLTREEAEAARKEDEG